MKYKIPRPDVYEVGGAIAGFLIWAIYYAVSDNVVYLHVPPNDHILAVSHYLDPLVLAFLVWAARCAFAIRYVKKNTAEAFLYDLIACIPVFGCFIGGNMVLVFGWLIGLLMAIAITVGLYAFAIAVFAAFVIVAGIVCLFFARSSSPGE